MAAALGAALLFGASTPLAKLLLGEMSPWLLAATSFSPATARASRSRSMFSALVRRRVAHHGQDLSWFG